jgi:trk system potassium uptake protein TrkH
MNFKMIFYTLGNILKVEACMLLLPLVVSLIYQDHCFLSFLFPILALLVVGFLLTIKKPKKTSFYAKEGFVMVGLSWILISLFGCLPFIISGEIPHFIDAFFETISGFTTTGSSILTDVEALSKSMLFWRSFTHWIGGMGVLVFILAILPNSEGDTIYILKAESPGPQVGKLVSKVRLTARILYLIYFALTIIEIIFLVCGKMPFFDSVVNSLATAGTGGFGIKNDSIGSYNHYCQIVIAIFMMIFGINFNLFYLLLIGNVKQALKSEEVFWYFGIILTSTVIIVFNLAFTPNSPFGSLADIIRNSFFQVSSIITTTGFATTDFTLWPRISQLVLIFLMFIGACAGSTGGGLKVSRFAILVKSIHREISHLLHPKSVKSIHFEGSVVEEDVVKSILNYFVLLILIFSLCLFCVSFDGYSFETNFTAVASCINNIGPGLDAVGPMSNYSGFSGFSKVVLIFAMLVGRLEIYPILVLFSPKIWINR